MVGWLGIALGTVVAVLGTVLYGGGVPQLLGSPSRWPDSSDW